MMQHSLKPRVIFLRLLTAGVLAFLLAACGGGDLTPSPTLPPTFIFADPFTLSPLTPNPATPDPVATVTYGITTHRADGNHLVAGQGNFPEAQAVDIVLGGSPMWVVGAPFADGSLWVIVLDDGSVEAFTLAEDGQVKKTSISPDSLPPGMPPLLQVQGEYTALLTAPSLDASRLTPPTVISDAPFMMAFIEGNGDLVLWGEGEVGRFEIDALPDGRIITDGEGRIVLLTGATNRYDHGIMGDEFEASGIVLIETRPEPRIVTTITIEAPQVIEGIMPIFADLDGDGQREIIVTQSDGEQGAQIVVYNQKGERIGASEAIGRGGRWRHQVAVAPFAPDGSLELVDNLTPHIGGIVEFFNWSGDSLDILAEVGGYTSHVIRTRNLDMGLAGDFDGDGQIELLLPSQERDHLGAVRHTEEGAEIVWTITLDGTLVSNLAAVTLLDGRIVLAAGRDDRVLRLWFP